jgi:hypothetical protein
MGISTATPYLFKEHREGKKGERILVPVRFSRSLLGKRGRKGSAKDGSFCPIPSYQSTQILSVRLVRKVDSFTSEGALFRQGDCFRIARHSARIQSPEPFPRLVRISMTDGRSTVGAATAHSREHNGRQVDVWDENIPLPMCGRFSQWRPLLNPPQTRRLIEPGSLTSASFRQRSSITSRRAACCCMAVLREDCK